SGAKLVLTPKSMLLQPDRIIDLIRDEGVDCTDFLPIVMRKVYQHLRETGRGLGPLRLVTVGSGPVSAGELAELQSLGGGRTRVVDAYGVSEATIDSTYCDVGDLPTAWSNAVLVGGPLPGTQTLVLDEHLQ